MPYEATLSDDGAIIDAELMALTPAQRNAAESGIDSARVEFIGKSKAAVTAAKKAFPEPVKTLQLMICDPAGKSIIGKLTTETPFGVVAVPIGTVPSIIFRAVADKPERMEGSGPYSLLGNVGSVINVAKWPAGTHAVKADVMSGANGAGTVLYSGSHSFTVEKVVDPAPGPTPDPSSPTMYTLLNRKPKLGEVGNKRTDLKSLGTTDYVVKPDEVLIGRSLSGRNVLCRLKKGEVAYLIDSTVRAGYQNQTVKGERYCVQCDGNEGTLYLIRCSLHDSSSAGIWGDNVVCIQCDFSEHGADCSKARRNCKFIECTMRDGGKNNPASHADGGQVEDGDGVLYQDCTISMIAGTRNGNTYKGSQGIIASGDSKNITVDGCDIEVWSAGGGSGVLAFTDGGSSATLTIKNTRIKAKLPIRAGGSAKLSNNETVIWN